MKNAAIALPLALLSVMAAVHPGLSGSVPGHKSVPLLHQESSFDLLIQQPYEQVAPLFGAQGERAWGGSDWDPHFLFPQPAQDIAGAIFTLEHGGQKTLWIMPVFDLQARRIEHLVILDNSMVTRVAITFPESAANVTKVHVEYQRTALSPAFNEHIGRLVAHDRLKAPQWQQAIDGYFASHRAHSP